MRLRLITAFILALGFAGVVIGRQESRTPKPQRPVVVTGRSKVATKYGHRRGQPAAVGAGGRAGSGTRRQRDRRGIAANAVEALVEPYYNGIGGDLFAIYYEAKTGKLYGMNAGGWAPTGLTPDLLKSKGNTGCRRAASTP
jgi:gamma-glutamyltranspeptidase/glutathione hydrolase